MISAQNSEWNKNRPMWAVDKQNPALLKHPQRWLSTASYQLGAKNGWLSPMDLSRIKHLDEVNNSKANRKH